jgi:uncharacterized membrane protein
MQYENIVVIERPVDDVFAYVMAIDTAPLWHSDMFDVRQASRDPLQVGSSLFMTATVLGHRVESTAEVTVWDAPHAARVETLDGKVPISLQFTFSSQGQGTLVKIVTEVTASGLLQMMLPMVAQTLHRQAQDGLEAAKKSLESVGANRIRPLPDSPVHEGTE